MKKITTLLSFAAVVGSLFVFQPDANAARPEKTTIVDIVLAQDGEFDVLQAAVVKAGLVDALNGNKQLTVFAPTDQAFIDTLSVLDEAAAIAAVNSMSVEDLADILLFHVTSGRRVSPSVLGAPQYKMLNGDTLTRQELLNAGIKETDIFTANGVIHVIDTVLLPQ